MLIFSENFSFNSKNYESEKFSDFSVHRIFESENLRFPFYRRKTA